MRQRKRGGGGVDGSVKWKSKSTGTAALSRVYVRDRCARPEFSIVIHDRRTTPTRAHPPPRPSAPRGRVVQTPACKCLSHLPSSPCSTDLSLREIMRPRGATGPPRFMARVDDERVTIRFQRPRKCRRLRVASH